MSSNKLLIGGLIGAAALGFYLHLQKMKKDKIASDKLLTDAQVKEVVVEETKKATAPFTDALLRDYEIVLSTAQVSKAVRQKGKQLTKGRYALMPDNIVKPLKLEDIQ